MDREETVSTDQGTQFSVEQARIAERDWRENYQAASWCGRSAS